MLTDENQKIYPACFCLRGFVDNKPPRMLNFDNLSMYSIII